MSDDPTDGGGGGKGFLGALFDAIASIFGRGEEAASDPVGDTFRGGFGSGGEEPEAVDIDLDPNDYSRFSGFIADSGASSAHINISARGVEVEFFNMDGERVGASRHDRISDFFEGQYDDLEAEGIEIEIQDEYARA